MESENDPLMMDALFEPEPQQWGFRGDPNVWAAMKGRLTGVRLPATQGEAVQLVRDTFRDLVGLDLEDRGDKVDGGAAYRTEFDTGGMSGGGVSLTVWRERLMPLLASRVEKAAVGTSWQGDPEEIPLLWEALRRRHPSDGLVIRDASAGSAGGLTLRAEGSSDGRSPR